MISWTLDIFRFFDWHLLKATLAAIVIVACCVALFLCWMWSTDSIHEVVEPKYKYIVIPTQGKYSNKLWFLVYEEPYAEGFPRTHVRSFGSDAKAREFIRSLDPMRSAHDQVTTTTNQATQEQRREFRHRQLQINDRTDTGSEDERDYYLKHPYP